MNREPESQFSTRPEEEDEIVSLKAFLQVIWRRAWILLATLVVFVGLAIASSQTQTPLYEASIKVLIGQKGDTTYAMGVGDLQGLTQTMAEAVGTRSIAEAVVEELDSKTKPQDVQANLSAEAIESTQFLTITYVDTNPERARRVANAVGSAFSKQISEISPNASNVTATVWDPAAYATPVEVSLRRQIMLALAVGLIVGMGLAFLVENLDDSWQSPEEVERVSGVPTFGVVPPLPVVKD